MKQKFNEMERAESFQMAIEPFPLPHLPLWQVVRQVKEAASSAGTKLREPERTETAGLNKQPLLRNQAKAV